MKKAMQLFSQLFGFEKLSKYEREHLHEANMQSSAYMGFIGVMLEIWMLIRQTITRIIPAYQEGGKLFELVFTYTSRYILILLFGLSLMLFCIFAPKKELTKGRFIALLVSGIACMLYSSFLRMETFMAESDTITSTMAGIVNFLIVAVYIILFLFGVTIVTYTLFRYRKKRVACLEHMAIILFTLVCLDFGVLVAYTDFWGGKQITSFLMMMIYFGCLLIYRPYITILLLSASTVGFYQVLLTFQNGVTFKPKEIVLFGSTRLVSSGDMVNYIMFVISLTTMCIAMYHARLKEARKTYGLHMATVELERKHKEAHEQFVQTTDALASAIDAKDRYTNGHSRRVAEYSVRIAKAVGKSEEECERIYFTALLHDVGKIGVPLEILTKKGRLTDDEFARIKEHPIMGGSILANICQSPWLSLGARYHHERYGGKGYPEGLKGEEIPEIARIIAVADAYDAMTSNRSYRNAIPQHIVREELVKGSGTQFDPEFAKAMLHMIDIDTEYRMQEMISGSNLTPTTSVRCDSIYHDCTEGIVVTKKPTRISLCSQPDDGFSAEECLPSLILFDALDGQVHPGEEDNRNLLYFEYAQIRLDGHVTARNTRNTEVRVLYQESDLEPAGFGEPEHGQRYKVEAARYKDHAVVRISDEKRTLQVILALPDTSRFVYIALSGEHCELHNIRIENDAVEIGPDDIPRIAEEISFIKACPEGDVPNVQVDSWRTDASEGILIGDGMTLSFHTMSLPTARLVWHCPFISVFSSNDGKISGADFREYILLRLDGENWESDAHVENKVQVRQQASFEGWNVWKDENKKGLDCIIKIKRNENVITMQTENLGIAINSVTTILDDVKDVYVALTGDQCAITNIHVSR